MNIHQKINMKANLIHYVPYNVYKQLKELNLIALAPYYFDRLIKQNNYIAEVNNQPQWVKNIHGYRH